MNDDKQPQLGLLEFKQVQDDKIHIQRQAMIVPNTQPHSSTTGRTLCASLKGSSISCGLRRPQPQVTHVTVARLAQNPLAMGGQANITMNLRPSRVESAPFLWITHQVNKTGHASKQETIRLASSWSRVEGDTRKHSSCSCHTEASGEKT